jgi:chromosome segregation ATPase
MRRNEARALNLEDQANENPMDPNIAALKTDVSNIKENVGELQKGLKTSNEAIVQLQVGQATLQGSLDTLRQELQTFRQEFQTLRQELKANIATLGESLTRWVVALAIAAAGAAFTFAKLIK